MNKIILLATLVIAILASIFVMGVINTKDQAVKLYNNYDSNIAKIENVHNEGRKTIGQISQVGSLTKEQYDKYLKAFVERGQSYDNSAMVWIKETLAQNDTKIYEKIMDVVERKNKDLTNANNESNYAATQVNNFVETTMNSFYLSFVSGYGHKVEIKQITSTASKEAIEKGVDDDINLNL